MKILVTGAAGFIGFHLSKRLISLGHEVVGIDNLNDYYDVTLKEARLGQLKENDGFSFSRIDLADRPAIEDLFAKNRFDRVINLAAQAGVRYSIENPHIYIQSNLVGFLNILEGVRNSKTAHLVYASSSSVYGSNTKLPFSVSDRVDHPISLYAATKKSNELMAHSYSHLYSIPTTGLRFFTVYGPWGRPDMALFKFTRAIIKGDPIDVYNEGKMERDFTYIDDIVEGVVRVMDTIPQKSASASTDDMSAAPYRIYNIGNHTPVPLLKFISAIENALGKKARINLLPMQPGDVPATFADVDALSRDVGFAPSTNIETGVAKFVSWYLDYYKVIR